MALKLVGGEKVVSVPLQVVGTLCGFRGCYIRGCYDRGRKFYQA